MLDLERELPGFAVVPGERSEVLRLVGHAQKASAGRRSGTQEGGRQWPRRQDLRGHRVPAIRTLPSVVLLTTREHGDDFPVFGRWQLRNLAALQTQPTHSGPLAVGFAVAGRDGYHHCARSLAWRKLDYVEDLSLG